MLYPADPLHKILQTLPVSGSNTAKGSTVPWRAVDGLASMSCFCWFLPPLMLCSHWPFVLFIKYTLLPQVFDFISFDMQLDYVSDLHQHLSIWVSILMDQCPDHLGC